MTPMAPAASRRGSSASAHPAGRGLRVLVDDALEAVAVGAGAVTVTPLRLVPSRETQTVLVADADAELLDLLAFHLGASFDVLQAVDGEEALRMALVEQPDVIVLDVRMPKLNGYEVTRLIRRHAETCDTPVILLDAHPERIDTLRGFAVGADDYLTKPLDPGRIVARVSEVLER